LVQRVKDFVGWLIGPGIGALVALLVLALLGLLTLYVAERFDSEFLRTAGKLVLFTGLFQLIFRAWVWKDAIDTFYEKLQIHDAIVRNGVENIWWFDAVPWPDLFRNAKSVTVVAVSARSLLADKAGLIRDHLNRKDASLALVLADPEDEELMNLLGRRYRERPDSRKQKCSEAINEVLKLAGECNAADRLTIRIVDAPPPYSCYRFDDTYLLLPYLAEPVRAPERIPAFCFREGEVVRKFLGKDLEYLLSDDGSSQHASA